MSFTADLSKFCKGIAPDHMAKVVRVCVIEIGSRLVERSPVGDASYWKSPPPPGYVGGRFRGNWLHGTSMPTHTTARIDAGGSATLADITAGAIGAPAAGVQYIVNNLPYAERLENGWSKLQAPHGIVSRVELEFPEIFRRAVNA